VNDARKELGLFLFDRSDLSDLPADDVTSLAECSRYRLVAARRRIYQQDECQPGDDSIFVVLRGEASLRVRLGKRREVILERLTPGSLFGGLPAVADLPNQESAVADSQVTLLEISRTSCTYLHFARPLLAQRLARIVTRAQLRRSHRSVELASLSA
jgi:CRP-like cAMP-binding protein